jgi:sirohydrochlorin cobaltochelatase
MTWADSALLLLGHGSTVNCESSQPTRQQADRLRQRGLFAEVHVGFWKEEPGFREALDGVKAKKIYVVPNFISSGYYTEEVIPRELDLTGPVTARAGREIYYCDPVGLHPSMTDVLLKRAREVVAASARSLTDPTRTACLLICGHGTLRNENSTQIIRQRAGEIRTLGHYADCQPCFMEQEPFVKDWAKLTPLPDIVVVPYFISNGLHSYEDIPVLLGLTEEVKTKGFSNPHEVGGRALWYASAIGAEDSMTEVILAQVQSFGTGPRGENPKPSIPGPIGVTSRKP